MTGKAAPALAGKRILVAKPGLDGHDVGAKIVAIALRDAGAEVIYTGLRKTPEFIARMAIDEDVDAVGLSILSGSHMALVRQTLDALEAQGGGDIRLFVGGTIPPGDVAALHSMGVRQVFTSEQPLPEVIATLAAELA